MINPPLQLESYSFTDLELHANSEYAEAGNAPPTYALTVEPVVAEDEQDGGWSVVLSIHTEPEQGTTGPYQAQVNMVGRFRVSKDYPSERARDLVQITGSSILYSAAREMLLLLSSRTVWGPMQLPTVSFMPPRNEEPCSPD